MNPRLFLLILASVSLSALAQLALKLGTSAARGAESAGVGRQISGLVHSPLVLVGLGLYGVGAILWLFVLSRAPLSLAYPFVGMGFILTMVAGAMYLNEDISQMRVFGTLMIAIGCVMVARSA
jgi:multidrug transporter EmrE-like cation transporter